MNMLEIQHTLCIWQEKINESKRIQIKRRTANERFHASGGADSSDTEQVTSSVTLVRALPIPPPA